MKNFTSRSLALACGALLLTGCQSAPAGLDRAINVTSLPTSHDAAPVAEQPRGAGPTAGLDLHIGAAALRINCATDALGGSARGTAALMCTWDTRPR